MKPNEIIQKQVQLLRKGYKIGIYPNYVEKMCNECDAENFKFAVKNRLGYEQIHLTNLGFIEPFHRCSIIGIPQKNHIIWYIVDPTYGQFFEDTSFYNYMFTNYNNFSIEILENGFIECSPENLSIYINSFICGYPLIQNDLETIYTNLLNLISTSCIYSEYGFKQLSTLISKIKNVAIK